MMEVILIYILLGCFAGLVSGMLGIGGGIVIVPVLAFVFQALGFPDAHVMHLALGTSLATIVFTSISAVIAHQRRRVVIWHLVAWLTPGLIVGALAGAMVAGTFSSLVLQRLFGVFEMMVGIYMFFSASMSIQARKRPGLPELVVSGSAIGTFSAVMGVGGGTMIVPYLSWRGWTMTEAVASSSACGFFIALFGTLGYVLAGTEVLALPELTTGYLYWPAFFGITLSSLVFAPVGAKLAHCMPVFPLRRLFSLVLVIVGAAMLLSL